MVVSGSLRARAKDVKAGAVSPRPWRRRRMFGEGDGDGEGGRVMVRVWLEGKSDWVGVLVGMMMDLVRDGGSIHVGIEGRCPAPCSSFLPFECFHCVN